MTVFRRALLACLLLVCLPLACGSAWAQQLAAIPPLDSPVIDVTATLDAAQKQQLQQQALDLQQRKGSQLQVLMVPSTQPEDIFSYSQRVFDAWKLGRQKIDDAVLIVVAKDDRRVRIHTGYGLEGAIPDATASRVIQEYMAPKFRSGDYGGGLIDGTAVLVKLIDGEPLPEPVSSNRSDSPDGDRWVFALFAAFIVANIVRGILGRAPKSLRSLFTGGAAGGVAWLLSALWPVTGLAAFFGFVFGLFAVSPGRYARHGGWGGWSGGGGWGSGGGGGFGGGGGWSGGGGMSGGGGASGSW
ncbi:MAG: TPM domain-containing protein [Pseudoxanthomonas sp.]